MNWKFWTWGKKPQAAVKQEHKETEKERLLRWHDILEKTASVIRAYDHINSRYLFNAQDNPEVKKILLELHLSKLSDSAEVWGLLGELEYILDDKYQVYLMNSCKIQEINSRLLEARITLAEKKDDRNLRPVREGEPTIDGAPSNPTGKTQ